MMWVSGAKTDRCGRARHIAELCHACSDVVSRHVYVLLDADRDAVERALWRGHLVERAREGHR
jgi:hypothetical protein